MTNWRKLYTDRIVRDILTADGITRREMRFKRPHGREFRHLSMQLHAYRLMIRAVVTGQDDDPMTALYLLEEKYERYWNAAKTTASSNDCRSVYEAISEYIMWAENGEGPFEYFTDEWYYDPGHPVESLGRR